MDTQEVHIPILTSPSPLRTYFSISDYVETQSISFVFMNLETTTCEFNFCNYVTVA